MTRKFLFVVATLVAAVPARANRAVMENLPSLNNAIFVDSNTASVNVGTAAAVAGISLNVAGAAQFGQGVTKSTFSTSGALTLASGAPLVLSGAAGTVTTASSVTASAFFGDASHLTGTALAASATNIAGGGVGQMPYQTGAGATAFLPAMGSGGIVVGNGTSVTPSTATLLGTASQVTVTKSATAVTLSLPATINVATSGNAATSTAFASVPSKCSAGFYPLGVDASGNAQNCTAAAPSSVIISSVNFTSNQTTAASTNHVCIATVPWVSAGNLVTVSFQGIGGNTTPTAALIMEVLLDGALVGPETLGGGRRAVRIVDTNGTTGLSASWSFNFFTTVASHNACLVLLGNGGTATIDASNNIAIFGIRE